LCVLALDRFADYHFDKIFVPVRETCAQTLAVVAKHSKRVTSVLNIVDNLSILQRSTDWEVQYAGFIAMKYLVATRLDLVESILPKIAESILLGYVSTN
jgi:TATA-binding protein-associated factor